MGILSDTLEDNKERSGQILSALSSTSVELPTGPSAALPCLICSDLVTDEEALQRHILDRHRHLKVYLKLNACVLPEVAFIDQPVSELIAVLLGDRTGTLTVTLDGRRKRSLNLTPGKPTSLEKYVPAGYVGTLGIEITIGNIRRDFVVYCRTQPCVNIVELDEAIWQFQYPLLEGKEPDWTRFQQHYLQDGSRNALEKRYLTGIYSYILGCCLEARSIPHAGKHLEEALGQLRPFSTALAHTARCSLALKLNAFRLLKHCGPGSRFYESNVFFNTQEAAIRSDRGLGRGAPSDRGLWIDDFLEMLLNAVSLFTAEDFDGAEKMISEMRNSPYFKEPNNRDKVILLDARTARARQRPEAANKAYQRLVHHPLFGREAERYREESD